MVEDTKLFVKLHNLGNINEDVDIYEAIDAILDCYPGEDVEAIYTQASWKHKNELMRLAKQMLEHRIRNICHKLTEEEREIFSEPEIADLALDLIRSTIQSK